MKKIFIFFKNFLEKFRKKTNINYNESIEYPIVKLIARNINNNIVRYKLKKYGDNNYSFNEIVCNGKKLIEIISIPNGVAYLYCTNNQLTLLPELPQSLKELVCFKNNIKQLPNLREYPNLTKVMCDIQCFESYMLEIQNIHFDFVC